MAPTLHALGVKCFKKNISKHFIPTKWTFGIASNKVSDIRPCKKEKDNSHVGQKISSIA